MMDRQSSDHDEPEDEISKAADCALLDEYWENLQRPSETDARQWLTDPDISDEEIARVFNFLNLLHRARQTSGSSHVGSQDSTLRAWEPFELNPESRASGW